MEVKEDFITEFYLIEHGFSKPKRLFDNRLNQFRVVYEINGYDCKILVSPSPQTVGEMTPEDQVDNFSSISELKDHHINDWQIFVNNMDHHLATFHYTLEIELLMELCDVPLK